MAAGKWVTSTIAVLTMLGVMVRPFRISEAVWAVVGALLLVVLGRLPAAKALDAIGKGTDVYLFLLGRGRNSPVEVSLWA
jgi:arsenical pump membrane protein